MIKKILLILIAISFVGCTSTFMYQELAYINKNMSVDEVADVVTSEEFDEGISLVNEEMSQDLHSLSANIGDKLQVLVTLKYYPTEEAHYVFLFQDNKLLYWGLPYQIANSSNELVQKASAEITALLENKYIED
jgi:hypothetical protein